DPCNNALQGAQPHDRSRHARLSKARLKPPGGPPLPPDLRLCTNAPAIRLANRSTFSENACPRRSSTVSRQIKAPAEDNSITLSSPNANKTRLPAARLDARATMASTLIHPIVSHSSLNASRTRASRSPGGLGGRTNAGGAQHSSAHTVVIFSAWT